MSWRVVDIVIGSSVGDAEHRALAAAVLFSTFPYTGEGIALGIVLGSIHVPLGIMGVVELPVVHSSAGDTVLEVVGAVGQGQDGHRAAEGESGDADLLSVHVGEGPQDAFYGPELVVAGRSLPCIHDRAGVGTAVHRDNDGIFLIGIQVYREAYRGREGVAVHLDEEHFGLGELVIIIFRALGVAEDGVLSLLAASYLH